MICIRTFPSEGYITGMNRSRLPRPRSRPNNADFGLVSESVASEVQSTQRICSVWFPSIESDQSFSLPLINTSATDFDVRTTLRPN